MATKKNPTNVNTKALLETYTACDNAVTEARSNLDKTMAQRSEAVKAIVSAIGPGPYEFAGQVVKARKRDTKDENGVVTGTTWFFYTIGDEVQKLD